MADHATRLRDSLGAADGYLHTLNMMADALLSKGDSADYAAFCLIIESVQKAILLAQEVVDDMEGGE